VIQVQSFADAKSKAGRAASQHSGFKRCGCRDVRLIPPSSLGKALGPPDRLRVPECVGFSVSHEPLPSRYDVI